MSQAAPVMAQDMDTYNSSAFTTVSNSFLNSLWKFKRQIITMIYSNIYGSGTK